MVTGECQTGRCRQRRGVGVSAGAGRSRQDLNVDASMSGRQVLLKVTQTSSQSPGMHWSTDPPGSSGATKIWRRNNSRMMKLL